MAIRVQGKTQFHLPEQRSRFSLTAFVKRHQVATYFALTFIISWGGVLVVAGPGGLASGKTFDVPHMAFAYPFMLAGPSLAGILLTGLVSGRAGLRELLSRLLRWRVGVRWYVVALLTAPLAMLAVLLALSLISSQFFPRTFASNDKAFLISYGITSGLAVGIFQELGWTGFAVHTMLRRRHGVFLTGLIVGLVFAAWNGLVVYWSNGATSASGGLPLAIYLPAVLFTWLPAYRVLMVWVYDRTWSLVVAMLMGMSYSCCTLFIGATQALTGVHLVTFYLVLTVALWATVAAVAAVNRGKLSQVEPVSSPVLATQSDR